MSRCSGCDSGVHCCHCDGCETRCVVLAQESVRTQALTLSKVKSIGDELAALRTIAEQAQSFHEDCGHAERDDPQCDGICEAWKVWRDLAKPAAPSSGSEKETP